MHLRNVFIFIISAGISAASPQSLLDQALHFADLYNWYAARPYFQQAQRLFDAAGDKRDALYAHWGAVRGGADAAPLPEISFRLGQELATNPLLQSDKHLRMFCFAIKGDFDGEFDSAAMKRDWEEVKTLAAALGSAEWQYRAEGQLGFVDFYDGDLTSAQRKVGEALIGATKIKDVGAQVFYLSSIANGYLIQGMDQQTLQFADRAISLATANPDVGYPILAHQARLRALVHSGKVDTAESELQQIMARPEVQNNEEQMADLTITASQIARAKNHVTEAIDYLNLALKHADSNAYSKMLPTIQSELSDLYRVTGNLPKAEELARDAAASAQSAGYGNAVPELLNGLAQVEIAGHHYQEADRTYDRAAAIQDVMIGNAESPLGKTALINGAGDLYEKHFALIADHLYDPAKAFVVIEHARGRVMTDLLFSGAKASPDSIKTETEISRLRLRLMSANSDQQLHELQDAIFMAEQRRSIAPEVSILKAGDHRPVTLSTVQRDLGSSEAILEYVLDDPTSYCLVITHGDARIISLKGKAAISADVEAFLKEIKAKSSAHAEARTVYADLIQPVAAAKGKPRLIIVRDGPLHLLPFDALADNTGHFLVESRIVSYAPSVTSFFLLRSARRKIATEGLLAVGGVPYDHSGLKTASLFRGYTEAGLSNLPNSEEEARSAAASLPSPENTLLLGDNATEWAFKKAVRHRIIHLAVHGIANELHPERAAVVLLSDPAKGEDGFLQASEIVQLPLDADLVVLSACDTAVGPVQGQEGIADLSNAFLLAGARTVIATLWSLQDDSALFLMKEFYAQLAHGASASDALAGAKRKMLGTFGETHALPYYWAGFTVEGFVPRPTSE